MELGKVDWIEICRVAEERCTTYPDAAYYIGLSEEDIEYMFSDVPFAEAVRSGWIKAEERRTNIFSEYDLWNGASEGTQAWNPYTKRWVQIFPPTQ